jgi:hypothetical protein
LLARCPPVDHVELVAPSSWSCPHGVERWRADCGCRIDGGRHPSQAWRTPLRRGLERLAAGLHEVYEREASRYVADPWRLRDEYGQVVAAGGTAAAEFVDIVAAPASPTTAAATTPREGERRDPQRLRELLEMVRDALRMFTSCAWFFDDIAGLEPRQVLRYAARAISFAGADGPRLEALLLEELARARSNDPSSGTGRDVYLKYARPHLPAAVRLAAAVVAARHAGARGRGHYATGTFDLEGDRVRVIDRRTGRAYACAARVTGATASDLVVELIDPERTYHLRLADLPERPRLAIRAVLRRSILPSCLTAEELDLLLTGEATLDGLVRVALIRTIEQLAGGDAAATSRVVHALLDLLEQLEAKVPFDAQTVFWRVWRGSTGERLATLDGLATRLGFTAGQTATGT